MPIATVQLPDGRTAKLEVPEGTTEQEIISFVEQNYGGPEGTTPMEPQVPEWGRENPNLYGVAGAARETLGPLIQAGSLVLGSLAGAEAGPPGMVAGAGLGYGMGENILRQADVALGNEQPYQGLVEAAKKTAGDVGTGAAFEMGGQAVAPLIKGAAGMVAPIAKRMPVIGRPFAGRGAPGTAGRAEVEAGEELLRQRPQNIDDLISQGKTEMETTMAAERAGAPRLTEAQLTGNQAKALSEQAQAKAGGGDFGRRVLETDKQAVDTARRNVQDLISGDVAGAGATTQETGRIIADVLEGERVLAKNYVDSLYAKLPDKLPVAKGELPNSVKALLKNLNTRKEVSFLTNESKAAINNLSSLLKNKKQTEVEINALKNIRDQLSDSASSAFASGNQRSWRLTKQFVDAVDSHLDDAVGVAGKYADDYAAARKAHGAYRDKFGKGVVGDITATGKQFGGGKVRQESVPSQFWGKGSETNVDQLISTVGKDKARTLITEHAIHDARATINSADGAVKWLTKHKPIMDKLGMKSSDVLSKQRIKDLVIGQGESSTFKTLDKNLRTIEPIMKDIYSASERQALKDYHTILKAVGRNKNISAGGGSTTADAISQAKQQGGVISGVVQLIALKLGQGFAYQSGKNVIKGIYNLANNNPKTVAKLMEDAAYDPKLAKYLMKVASKAGTKGMKAPGPEVAEYLRSIGAYGNAGFISPVPATRPAAVYGAPPAMGFGYDELIKRELGAK